MRRILLLAATLLVALPALGAGWSSRNPTSGRTAVYEWQNVATDPPTAVDMTRCARTIWQYTDDTTGLGDVAAGATLYHCTDPALAFGDCTSAIVFGATTTGQSLNLRPAYFKLDVTAGTTTAASNARVQALCQGGDPDTSEYISYDAVSGQLEFAGTPNGYWFDGPIDYLSDGNGPRLEYQWNELAWPLLRDDYAALFAKENEYNQAQHYVERQLSCTDVSDGSTNTRTCPYPAASAGIQTGGATDGYCDDFGTYGDCQLVTDKAMISTSRDKVMIENIVVTTPSMIASSTGGFYGAKCASIGRAQGQMTWCNASWTKIMAPENSEIRVNDITFHWNNNVLPYTNPPSAADCTIALVTTDDLTDIDSCNRPGIDVCTEQTFYPLVQLGDNNTPVGTPELLGDVAGETVTIRDFDGDGNTEDIDAVTTGYMQLVYHIRGWCTAGTAALGSPCYQGSHCGAGGVCTRDTSPWDCLEVPTHSATINYTVHDSRVLP